MCGLEHLIALSRQLQTRGVDLVVLDQGIETSTAEFRWRADVELSRADWAAQVQITAVSGTCPAIHLH